MEVEAGQPVDQSEDRGDRQQGARRAPAKNAPETGDQQERADEDGRVHDLQAIAGAVVLFGRLEATQETGEPGDKREPALESAFTDLLRDLGHITFESRARQQSGAVGEGEDRHAPILQRSASARFSSMPSPGSAGSGRKQPPTRSGRPSKSMFSMRA